MHEGSKPVAQQPLGAAADLDDHADGDRSPTLRARSAGGSSGNRLYLKYTMKGGLERRAMCCTFSPIGRTLLNRMTVRKFGIVVAQVDEMISKLD